MQLTQACLGRFPTANITRVDLISLLFFFYVFGHGLKYWVCGGSGKKGIQRFLAVLMSSYGSEVGWNPLPVLFCFSVCLSFVSHSC